MNLFGKRKFVIAVMSLCMGFVLALLGKMSGSEFVTASGLVMGLYGGASVGNQMAKKRNNGKSD